MTRQAKPISDDFAAQLREGFLEERRLADSLASRQAAISALEDRISAANERAARANQCRGDEAAEAILRGSDVPDSPQNRDIVLRATEEVAACNAARPSLVSQLVAAEEAIAVHTRRLSDTKMDFSEALTTAALPLVTNALNTLTEPLARLAAVSVVRERLMGARFRYDAARHPEPIGAKQIVASLIQGLPSSLKPAQLTVEAVMTRADAIAADVLAQVQLKEIDNV